MAVSTSAQAGFVLDALEQAVHERRPTKAMGLVHHSDRNSKYLSIKYTERLDEAGIDPSVGSVGDSYNNTLAETVNGLFKAEVIHRRLLEPIGNIPPAEAEAKFYAALETEDIAAQLTESASGKPVAVQSQGQRQLIKETQTC